MITKKLHCIHDVSAGTLAISLCLLDDIERPRTLQSSTDGIVALETHTQARPTVRGWRTIAKRTIALPAHELADVARRAALAAFAEPDVGAVVVEVGPVRRVFLRDATGEVLRVGWSTSNGWSSDVPHGLAARPIA
jgi:hypothetical protein